MKYTCRLLFHNQNSLVFNKRSLNLQVFHLKMLATTSKKVHLHNNLALLGILQAIKLMKEKISIGVLVLSKYSIEVLELLAKQ